MSWFGKIFGSGVKEIADGVTGVAEVFVGNKKEREMASHLETMASLQQFASEFQYAGQKSWFGRFIDGWNRLPRPLISTSVLLSGPGSVYMIFNHPEEFTLLTQALAVLPGGIWTLYGIIIAFYFGSRTVHHRDSTKISLAAMDAFTANLAAYNTKKEEERKSEETTRAGGNLTLQAFKESQT